MITQAIRALPNQIPYMWHQVKPLIDKALIYSNGEMLVEDILECLLKNEQELVIGYNNDNEILMALVGEIVNYPRKKVYRIITWSTKSGHDYEEWMPLFGTVEVSARKHGCDYIEAWARKGLAKKLKWEHEQSIVIKHL